MTRMPHALSARARLLPLLLLLAVLPAASLHAQAGIVIYRCVAADGTLTIQNDKPCPPGNRQTTQTIDPPPQLPSYQPRATRLPEIVAAQDEHVAEIIDKVTPEPVPEAKREPPPALFQCVTWDDNRYLTPDDTAQERCAPLRTVTLGGTPQQGAVRACQTVHDTCQPVAEDALCKTWQRRVDEAEFRWKFAHAARSDPRRIEYERLAAILANSTCAQ